MPTIVGIFQETVPMSGRDTAPDILEANEIAWMQRYGESLREKLHAVLEREELDDAAVSFYEKMYRQSSKVPDDINSEQYSFLLCCGFAEGTFLKRLLNSSAQTLKLLSYEPDEASFLYAACSRDISGLILDPRLYISVYDANKPNQLAEVLEKQLEHIHISGTGVITVPAYEDFYAEIAQNVIKTVRDRIRDLWEERRAAGRFKEKPFLNELYALGTLSENYLCGDLLDRIKDKSIPVILVAAGPSLRRNAAQLRKAKGKALIVAASHAYKTLFENHVEPDLLVVQDPDPSAVFLADDKERKSVLLISPHADREVQELYRGRCIYMNFSDELAPADIYKRSEVLKADYGSVMTSAFDIFADAGFRTLIFVGQDLAYGEAGMTHADGSANPERNTGEAFILPGVNGGQVRSRTDWYMFLNYFERKIAMLPAARVIDATEGGALIRGTGLMSLEAAIEECCTKDYPEYRDLPELLPKAWKADQVAEWRNVIKAKVSEVREFLADVDEALFLGEQLIGMIKKGDTGSAAYRKTAGRYDRVYHLILEERMQGVVIYYAIDRVLDYMQQMLKMELSGDTEKKLLLERELFLSFREKSLQLEKTLNNY